MRRILITILFVAALAYVPTLSATMYYVNGTTGDDTNDGLTPGTAKKTIQAGIDATSDTDTAQVADGTYTGTGNRDLDFGGKAITVKSENGAENCIIDCEGSGRGFNFHSGETRDAVLDGFTITNGRVVGPEYGGGIFCTGSSPTIVNCIISNNEAALGPPNGWGGGIYISDSSSPLIENCVISDNIASHGSGAIDCHYYSNPEIINCLITGNSAGYGGGFMYVSMYCDPQIINCTITRNSAGGGGAIYHSGWANPTFTNCILWDNTPNEISAGLNPGTPCFYNCDIEGGWGGCGSGNINEDPLFVAGLYLSQIAAGQATDSPCVDAGDDTATNRGLDDRTTRTDHVPDAGTVDMGYHYPLAGCIIFVDDDAPNDPGAGDPAVSDPLEDGSPDHPFDAIQEGIDAATDGCEVIVLDGTYVGVGNRDLDYGGKSIIVRSENGADVTIIDCEGTELEPHRGFHFHSGETEESRLIGFTIKEGHAAASWPLNGGAAILCDNSSPTIIGCVLSGGEGFFGGGIAAIYGASPVIRKCRITGNSATEGGGIYCGFAAHAEIINCLVWGNTASLGGGIECQQSSPTLTNSTITDNTATTSGGGLTCHEDSNPVFVNCILWGNTPDQVFLLSSPTGPGNPVFNYCDIEGGWSGSGSNNMDSDPNFGVEYHLLGTSPCIDRGTAAGAPVTDIDGDERWDKPGTEPDPSIVDIGADEYVGFTVIDVEIDIKPGNDPNSINLGSNGVVPVAFLTDENFDAASIDPTTITLAGDDSYGLIRMRGKNKDVPMASLVDVDGDGDDDLLVHLETESLALGLEPAETICTLSALTFTGLAVQGSDFVNIVPQ